MNFGTVLASFLAYFIASTVALNNVGKKVAHFSIDLSNQISNVTDSHQLIE
jgi:hypothetical protein